MAAFGQTKKRVLNGFLKLKHAIPSHDTDPCRVLMIDLRVLDANFGWVLVDVAALLR
jgi:hypothetical protein